MAIGHQLLHSDAFASELEAIGLDDAIFGPHIPAPIFQALVPRRAGVFGVSANTYGTVDEPATFARSSDGIYVDADGLYRIGANGEHRPNYQATGEFLGYLFEPAKTNKCTNHNGTPNTGVNMAVSGPGSLSGVADATFPLGDVGIGDVYELDNSGGGAPSTVTVSGDTGNTNEHTWSCDVRKVSGANATSFGDSSTGPSLAFANSDPQRLWVTGTPGATTSKFALTCEAGTVARFLLNQLEELNAPTTPIITAGASGTRAIDSLNWATQPSQFSNDAGTIIVRWRPAFPRTSTPLSPTSISVVTLNPTTLSQIYLAKSSSNLIFRSYDGTNVLQLVLPVFIEHADFDLMTSWETGTGMRTGYRLNRGAWTFSSVGPYAGAWANGGAVDRLRLMELPTLPGAISQFRIWDKFLDTTAIEKL